MFHIIQKTLSKVHFALFKNAVLNANYTLKVNFAFLKSALLSADWVFEVQFSCVVFVSKLQC